MDVAERVKQTSGANPSVTLSVQWLETGLEFEGCYTHAAFYLNWVREDLTPHPETLFRIWLFSEKTEAERDRIGRELVYRTVELLNGFGIATLAVSTGQGFFTQGPQPVQDVARMPVEFIDVNETGGESLGDEQIQTDDAMELS